MKISDVMTPDVATVEPDDSVARAVGVMIDRRVSGVPVVDGHRRLRGILTESDLLRRAELDTAQKRPRWLEFLIGTGQLAREYVHTHARRVEEVMTDEVITATPDTDLGEAVRLMERKRIRRLPIVEDGVLVGIVSRADLVRALARLLDDATITVRPDAAIADDIRRAMAAAPWSGHSGVTVAVSGGVVTLDGVIVDERQREALRVLAENVSGVVRVVDKIVWIEPETGVTIGPPG